MLFSRSGILAEAINTNILTKNHPDSRHSHPDSTHSHHSPHSVPRFLIPTFTDSPKNVIFVFWFLRKSKKNESEFVIELVWIMSLKLVVKSLLQSFFMDHLERKSVSKKTTPTMCTLVEELFNCCDHFLRLSGNCVKSLF